ncbi:hypothetical protein [Helicobacter ailurogastricus]|nr:hypothetical protein [Helicobacter ailurogastricus]
MTRGKTPLPNKAKNGAQIRQPPTTPSRQKPTKPHDKGISRHFIPRP